MRTEGGEVVNRSVTAQEEWQGKGRNENTCRSREGLRDEGGRITRLSPRVAGQPKSVMRPDRIAGV